MALADVGFIEPTILDSSFPPPVWTAANEDLWAPHLEQGAQAACDALQGARPKNAVESLLRALQLATRELGTTALLCLSPDITPRLLAMVSFARSPLAGGLLAVYEARLAPVLTDAPRPLVTLALAYGVCVAVAHHHAAQLESLLRQAEYACAEPLAEIMLHSYVLPLALHALSSRAIESALAAPSAAARMAAAADARGAFFVQGLWSDTVGAWQAQLLSILEDLTWRNTDLSHELVRALEGAAVPWRAAPE